MSIAYVQSATGYITGAGSTITITLGASPTNGNCLIIAVAIASGIRVVSSISQTGASWTKQIQHNNSNGSGNTEVEIWAAFNVSSAGTGITITLSAASLNAVARCSEFSGVATSSALDKTASDDDSTDPANMDNGGSGVTTTQANELWVTAYSLMVSTGMSGTGGITDDGTGTWASGLGAGSFGGGNIDIVAIGSNPGLYSAEKIVSATGNPTNNCTFASTLSGWSGVVATFKGVASASANYSLFYAGD